MLLPNASNSVQQLQLCAGAETDTDRIKLTSAAITDIPPSTVTLHRKYHLTANTKDRI